MSLQDYASYAQLMDTRDRIASDEGRTFYQKAQDLGPIGFGLRSQPERKTPTLFGDVLRGAITAALGYGLGRGIGSTMGLSEASTDSLATSGAMMGGIMGISKTGCTKEEAFRIGFVKAAIDRGHFKTAFIGGLLLAPITGASRVATRIGESAGSLLGAAESPTEDDTDIVRENVEAELLRQELERVKAARRTTLLKQVLAKRTAVR